MGVSRGGLSRARDGGRWATRCLGCGWRARRAQRQKQIQNGLPDALDLLIVCVEAGAGLDAAIVKASEELALAYPASRRSCRLITTETRAGKPRLEAFRNFAQRTGVDDVRSLVAMLVQTDRFGTSVAQALRTHAATSHEPSDGSAPRSARRSSASSWCFRWSSACFRRCTSSCSGRP